MVDWIQLLLAFLVGVILKYYTIDSVAYQEHNVHLNYNIVYLFYFLNSPVCSTSTWHFMIVRLIILTIVMNIYEFG